MTFRPYTGMTFACAILFAILCGLGVWQLERLQWKLALIATVNGHMTAAPVTLDRITAMPADEAQYRRVTLHGHFDHAKEAYVFTTDASGAPVYHVLTPFVTDGGKTLMVDRGAVPKEKLDPATRAAGNAGGETAVTGVWRAPDAPGLFTPPPDLAHRVWYSRDLAGIAAAEPHHAFASRAGRSRRHAESRRAATRRADCCQFPQPASFLCRHLVRAGDCAARCLVFLSYFLGPDRVQIGGRLGRRAL